MISLYDILDKGVVLPREAQAERHIISLLKPSRTKIGMLSLAATTTRMLRGGTATAVAAATLPGFALHAARNAKSSAISISVLTGSI